MQDDANWLALIDAEDRIRALPLPPGPSGARVFSSKRGNRREKFDLEACITVPGQDGPELVGFASGSRPGREWILRVREKADVGTGVAAFTSHEQLEADIAAQFLNATRFYESLRTNEAFCGAGLNIEGAVALDSERIMLFQRGNALPREGREPVDATGEVSWPALAAHLHDPENVPPPRLERVTSYDLGALGGVRLTFSDAEYLGEGRILYSASAEEPHTGRIAGSVLGVMEPDGSLRWTELTDQDGRTFQGKIEGLSLGVRKAQKIRFVIDDDDETVPSELFEATLNESFFRSRE